MATKTYEELVELLQDGKIGHLHFVLQGENAQDFFGLVQVARHRPYGRIGGVLHRADGNRRDGTSGSQ